MRIHRSMLVALSGTVLRGVAILLVGAPAFADTSGTLTVSTDTVLAENHNGDVIIVADGVTLDCSGHRISGGGLNMGILLDGRTRVTVKNCHVSGFVHGIFLFQASNNVFTGNTANYNHFGFALAFSGANQFMGNIANHNTFAGFAPGASSGNAFTRNTANDNGRNLFEIHAGSANNTLTDNTANGNGVFGIALNSSSHNRIQSNVANRNASSGFSLTDSSVSNILEDNSSDRNGFGGFDLRGSSNNHLLDNRAKQNVFGFYFENSSLNTVLQNHACSNKPLDAFQDANSTGNIFDDNHFCRTDGI
jgi:parallel beta-helix repeat protein